MLNQQHDIRFLPPFIKKAAGMKVRKCHKSKADNNGILMHPMQITASCAFPR